LLLLLGSYFCCCHSRDSLPTCCKLTACGWLIVPCLVIAQASSITFEGA
jgi:hypothetical protein